MYSQPSFWTSERAQRLSDLWAQGMSATQIAGELGCTRNAVVGRVWRMRLSQKPRAEPKPRPYPARRRARYQSLLSRFDVVKSMPVPTGVGLMELDDAVCKYPVGDDALSDEFYCGAPRSYRCYCVLHAQLCYPNLK